MLRPNNFDLDHRLDVKYHESVNHSLLLLLVVVVVFTARAQRLFTVDIPKHPTEVVVREGWPLVTGLFTWTSEWKGFSKRVLK